MRLITSASEIDWNDPYCSTGNDLYGVLIDMHVKEDDTRDYKTEKAKLDEHLETCPQCSIVTAELKRELAKGPPFTRKFGPQSAR